MASNLSFKSKIKAHNSLAIIGNWLALRRSGLTKTKVLIALTDIALVGMSSLLAVFLRFDFVKILDDHIDVLHVTLYWSTALAIIYTPIFQLYRDIWRYTSVNTLLRIVGYTSAIISTFIVLRWMVDRGESIPRSILIIQWPVLILLLAFPRIFVRLLYDRRSTGSTEASKQQALGPLPILLIGIDLMGELFLRHIRRDPAAIYRVVGVIDPSSTERGRHIFNVPVFPGGTDLIAIVKQLSAAGKRPTRFVLSKTYQSDFMRRILLVAEMEQITICRLPHFIEFRQPGEVVSITPRPISVEELIGRREARLNCGVVDAFVRGRRVLITGGGGSIGAELVRQLARCGPDKIVILDNSEYNLYAVEQTMTSDLGLSICKYFLADIRDKRALQYVFETERPEIVFHAAALKHVPIVEANPFEGFLTNFRGTRNVADLACQYGSSTFVLISTDKAVNPTSVMGACKRLAELYIQSLDLGLHESQQEHASDTRFLTVRFGNVLGSSGSVVPLFQRQLLHGGPLTVTHPEIERYFMTIREAVELILQAAAYGTRAEVGRGQIFVLDMGPPVRIVDVARQMIRLAGLTPDVDVKIQFVGLRSGEKMFEELFADNEKRRQEEIPGILTAVSSVSNLVDIVNYLSAIDAAIERGDRDDFYSCLTKVVPEYRTSYGDEVVCAAE